MSSSQMKRYLLFTHDRYYLGGARYDFCGDFDTEEEAVLAGDSKENEFFNIIDTRLRKCMEGTTREGVRWGMSNRDREWEDLPANGRGNNG